MISRAKKTPITEWWWTVDRSLLGVLLAMLLIGFLLSFTASPAVALRITAGQEFPDKFLFIRKHAIFILPAAMCLIGLSFATPRQARILALLVLVGSLGAMGLTLLIGVEIKGSQRWLAFGGLSMQPSEFMKPAFAIISAWLFAEGLRRKDVPAKLMSFILWVIIVGLLILQPDIGQTFLVTLTWGALLFMAGIPWILVFVLLALGVGGLVLAYLLVPHVHRRIDSFLDPTIGDTFQVTKAMESFAEGGWFGKGPGEGLTKLQLPDAHADFIFAAVASEFGIIFCLFIVGLFMFVVLRALGLALAQQDTFARLAGSALAIQFGAQAAINIGVNLSLLPPKGMTLPFISYGGTSMVATAIGMGLMLALTRKRPVENTLSGLPPKLKQE